MLEKFFCCISLASGYKITGYIWLFVTVYSFCDIFAYSSDYVFVRVMLFLNSLIFGTPSVYWVLSQTKSDPEYKSKFVTLLIWLTLGWLTAIIAVIVFILLSFASAYGVVGFKELALLFGFAIIAYLVVGGPIYYLYKCL